MRSLALSLALAVGALAGAAHAAPCRLADLGWMTGVWRSDAPDTASEERWAAAPGDRLMGSSWSLHRANPNGVLEIESIVAGADGQISLRVRHFDPALGQPWEALATPMIFAAASCGPSAVFFDGEDSHAGEHINYRRTGDTLTFTGDFLHDGKPAEVVIRFTRRAE